MRNFRIALDFECPFPEAARQYAESLLDDLAALAESNDGTRFIRARLLDTSRAPITEGSNDPRTRTA